MPEEGGLRESIFLRSYEKVPCCCCMVAVHIHIHAILPDQALRRARTGPTPDVTNQEHGARPSILVLQYTTYRPYYVQYVQAVHGQETLTGGNGRMWSGNLRLPVQAVHSQETQTRQYRPYMANWKKACKKSWFGEVNHTRSPDCCGILTPG